MTRMLAAAATATAMGVMLAAPALATDIVVEDFIGTIAVVEGPAGLDVQRDHEGLSVSESGGTIRIDGGFARPGKEGACDYGLMRRSPEGRLRRYPSVRVSVPEGSTLTVRNTVAKMDVSVALADADLSLMGCFDTALADVLDLEVNKSGSGEFEARDVGVFSLSKSGSGEVELREVGEMSMSQSGSGDLDIERVGKSLDVRKSGSGDIEVGEAYGDLTLRQSGSGDLDVGGGDIATLTVIKSGSGDVEINARVGSSNVRSSGSGSVDITTDD